MSKSGGTKETRNGMLVAETAYRKAGLSFAKHAVAVVGPGATLGHALDVRPAHPTGAQHHRGR